MIAQVENAILARLKAAGDAGVLGYKWGTLDSYPEDWDLYLKEKFQRAPAAWVVFGGWREPEERRDGIVEAPSSFMVVVAAESLRNNETFQRHGAPNEPGSYQLLIDIAKLLRGQTLGLGDDIDPLEIGAVRSVRPTQMIMERKLSVFALEVRTTLYIDAGGTEANDDIGDFATFHANWDIQPFGNVQPPLPADVTADATDHVQLETS